MKCALREWIIDQPSRKPKELSQRLNAACQNGQFGNVAMPSLHQVQNAVKYMRVKEFQHLSTVDAVENEILNWTNNGEPELRDSDEPFTFGVATAADGRPILGDGGLRAFRVGM